MTRDNYNIIIENYLDGSMTPSEKNEFERQLLKDEELSKMFAERKNIQDIYITTHEMLALKKTIRASIEFQKKREKKHYLTTWKFSLSAASVIIFMLLGYIFVFDKAPSRDKNYISIEPPKGDSVTGINHNINTYSNRDIVKGKGHFDEFFPDEYAQLHTTDTICFTWPLSITSKVLLLYDSKGQLIKKMKIKKNNHKYYLLPGTLNEGIYYWKFMNDTTLIRISLQK